MKKLRYVIKMRDMYFSPDIPFLQVWCFVDNINTAKVYKTKFFAALRIFLGNIHRSGLYCNGILVEVKIEKIVKIVEDV